MSGGQPSRLLPSPWVARSQAPLTHEGAREANTLALAAGVVVDTAGWSKLNQGAAGRTPVMTVNCCG